MTDSPTDRLVLLTCARLVPRVLAALRRRRVPFRLVEKREGDRMFRIVTRHVAEELGCWLADDRKTDLLCQVGGNDALFVHCVADKIIDEQRRHRRWEARVVESELLVDRIFAPADPEPEADRPPLPAAWERAKTRLLRKKKKPTAANFARELGVSVATLRRQRAALGLTKPQKRRAR